MNDELTDALEHLADQAPHHADLASVVRDRVRRERRRRSVAGLAGLVVVAVAGFAGFRLLDRPAAVAVVPAGPAGPACHSDVAREALPEWARAGFTPPDQVMPFVRSASGNVVAILFTDALYSPPKPSAGNKVLWDWHDVPNTAGLRVTARLDGTGPVVTAGLPQPYGPSSVDLPAPGCWRLTLSWPGGNDTIDLESVAP